MEEIYIGESDIDENGEKTPRVGVGLLCAGGAGGVAATSACFLVVNFVIKRINKNIAKAIIRKSKVACKNWP